MKLALGVVILACGVAVAAPSAEDLRAQGEQLAKQGRFTEAIVAFKQSNKLVPRATNLCLIGLAYTRRELWSQAEVMIDRCKHDATAQDPVPEWLPELEQLVAQRLANVDVAEITITIEPSVAAELTVSSFAPDETFAPRTIHLPIGNHLLVATAAGFERAEKSIEVRDRTPQHVVMRLEHVAVVTPPAAGDRKLPLVLIGTGAAVIVGGIIYHATYVASAAHHLSDATNPKDPHPDEYDAWSHRYDVRRVTVLGLYGIGLVATAIGVALRLTDEHAPAVAVTPLPGGAMIGVGWQ